MAGSQFLSNNEIQYDVQRRKLMDTTYVTDSGMMGCRAAPPYVNGFEQFSQARRTVRRTSLRPLS